MTVVMSGKSVFVEHVYEILTTWRTPGRIVLGGRRELPSDPMHELYGTKNGVRATMKDLSLVYGY